MFKLTQPLWRLYPFWRRATKWNQGKSACSTPAYSSCCGIVFTKNTACSEQIGSGIMNSGAGTMAAFCSAQKCKMTGQRHRTFGALQTVSRSVKPLECWDLDTLQGFNFHKVLNTHSEKQDAWNLSYEKPQLLPFKKCLLFGQFFKCHDVGIKKSNQMWAI